VVKNTNNLYKECLYVSLLANYTLLDEGEEALFDYREKQYSIHLLELGRWRILYNAEFDGFMRIPMFLPNPTLNYNLTESVPVELKLIKGSSQTIPTRKLVQILKCEMHFFGTHCYRLTEHYDCYLVRVSNSTCKVFWQI